MEKKDYHQIMTEITSNLTGDPEKDKAYLMSKCDEYKTHEMSKEILRGIGRLIYTLLPDDVREELDRASNNESLGWKATLDEIDFCLYKKDYRKAQMLLESLIEKIEAAHLFEEDEVSIYKDFGETFEEILYTVRFEPKKTLRSTGLPFSLIYLRYGSLLFEIHEHEKAKEALRKALEWNPVNASIAFELAENYKATGDLESFFEITKQTYKYCFRPATLARYYRNLAFYFSEKKRFKEAAVCVHVSGVYDDTSANLQSELYYIQEMNGGKRIDIEPTEGRALLEKEGISTRPDDDVLGLSFTLAKQCLDNKDWEAADYFLGIFNDLTHHEEMETLHESIKKNIAREKGN